MDGIDIVDPRFKSCVLPNAPLEKLGEGFAWLEGPVWFADHDCLLFSDIPNNRTMRWSESTGVSVFRQPTGFVNGHCRDCEGRLIGCSQHRGCLERIELDGGITMLVDRHEGKRLNSPNDVVVKSDGTIWFSDPPYGIETDYQGGKRHAELPANLYRFDPRDDDHSALGVANAERSAAFYELLGLGQNARQINRGPAQQRLDALPDVVVDVVALRPATAPPHVELLGYRTPRGRALASADLRDIAADRLVLQVEELPLLVASLAAAGMPVLDHGPVVADGCCTAALLRDPDGHLLVLVE